MGRRVVSIGASTVAHLAFALLVLLIARATGQPPATVVPANKIDVVFLPNPGRAGGGGGGPRAASAERQTIPKHPPPAQPILDPAPIAPEPPKSIPTLDAPVETDGAKILQMAGAGLTDGLGGPPDRGAGPGRGPGVGPGGPGGTDGGVREPGGDVSNPVPIREVRPQYTNEAMRARLQGPIELAVVVLANGTVGDVRITKSFNPALGLDAAAVEAAKQWLFSPARRQGRAVDVRVRLILEFKLY
jgi:protein TonB